MRAQTLMLAMTAAQAGACANLDVGLDVNGPAVGLFNGVAPDIGAWESP